MEDHQLQYAPSWKLSHYKWFRIRWCSFKSTLATTNVLFLYCNGLGTGKTNLRWYGPHNDDYQQYTQYSFSMPVVPNQVVAYNVESDPWRWMEVPEGANLKNMTWYVFPDGSTAGRDIPGFIGPNNPCCFEIEFRCAI
jgi:hypothetical protein